MHMLDLGTAVMVHPITVLPLTAAAEYMKWYAINARGQDNIAGREGHTMVVYGNRLVLFGGFDGYNYLNDLHVFNTGMFSLLCYALSAVVWVLGHGDSYLRAHLMPRQWDPRGVWCVRPGRSRAAEHSTAPLLAGRRWWCLEE
jgi:hypothetical protein